MNRRDIIARIDEIIVDRTTPWMERCKELITLSYLYWDLVFPERGTVEYAQLSSYDREQRWIPVRAEDHPIIAATAYPERVHEVLDSPTVGASPWKWLK